MRLEHYWIEMNKRFTSLAEGEWMHVSLEELSVQLHCTPRNVKLVVKRMEEKGWIEWHPGQGRGRRSRMRLMLPMENVVLVEAERLLAEGKFQECLTLTEGMSLSSAAQSQLDTLLRQAFGYRRLEAGEGEGRSVLRFPFYRTPGSLDPAYTTRRTELHLVRQLFDTLIVYDRQHGGYMPGLAHSWSVSEDGLCWTLDLQKHVRFHDGTLFTAEDAAYSLRRLMSGSSVASPYASLYNVIAAVETQGAYLLRLRLREPAPYMLALLAAAPASIVPVHRAAAAPFALQPIGTGPFRISRPDPRCVALDANPHYYNRPALLDRIELWQWQPMRPTSVTGTEASVTSGRLNFRHYRQRASERLDQHWQEGERIDRGCKYVVLCRNGDGPLEQARVRERIHQIVHSDAAARQLGDNRGPLATSLMMSDEEGGADRAGRALSEACHTDEHQQSLMSLSGEAHAERHSTAFHGNREHLLPLARPLRLCTYRGAGDVEDAQWLCRALTEAGLAVHVEYVDYEQLYRSDEVALPACDLLLLELPAAEDDEWTLLSMLASERSPIRRSLPREQDEELQQRLKQGLAAPTREERLAVLHEVERMLIAQRSLVLWYRWRQMASWPPGMEGVVINDLGWVEYKRMWMREDRSFT
ncbi:ABC transporter substrate-binding protein [Paenibacillus sp. YYML68]|uniref:ABC transporter substrate-binding protein n=1 Tax=Paenibacillus sp. YYML68 TaxID=2909250 RepID=UPI002493BF15|nr:ABC transporter substrate-binding protein [Paenibacillus sp. YYML68]